MKQVRLNNGQISNLCLELATLLHAGVSAADGLFLLAEETDHAEDREFLKGMARQLDEGMSLPETMRESGRFPDYVFGLMKVGERSGRKEALMALSDYYDNRSRMDRRIRDALLYPAVMLMLMLVVIVVLLVKVLPVFNDVYAALGGRLTGMAGGLLAMGRVLDALMPLLCAILAVLVVFMAAFAMCGSFREKILGWWQKRNGDRGVSRQMQTARLAHALAMGLRSGLPLEEALQLAGDLQGDVSAAKARCEDCVERLEKGEDLATALKTSGVLPASACRLLSLGQKSGSSDTVMEEVARRLSEESEAALDAKVSRVEPTLVLVTSLLVGVILLSVMLPLMHIMTAIG